MKQSNFIKKSISLIVVVSMLMGLTACGGTDIAKEAETAAKWVMAAIEEPGIGSVGGDWAVKGIVAAKIDSDEAAEFISSYCDNALQTVTEAKGALDETYYTTYARVTIGLAAAGENAADFGGYNLVEPLDNYKKITEQGVNAASFALIASQISGVQLENEQRYIEFIINELEEKQLYVKYEMMDYCSMAVEALSFYAGDEKVISTIEKCVQGLSDAQQDDGSLGNCESTAEAIIALTCAGVDPLTDERFVKNENTLLDGLLEYKNRDGYVHVLEGSGESDRMATEKALLALGALIDFSAGENFY